MLSLNKALITEDVIDLYFQNWSPDGENVYQDNYPSIGNYLLVKVMNVINLDNFDGYFKFESYDLEFIPFNTWFSMEVSVGNSRRHFTIAGAFDTISSDGSNLVEYETSGVYLEPNQVYELMGVFRALPGTDPWIQLEAYYRPKFDYSNEWNLLQGWQQS